MNLAATQDACRAANPEAQAPWAELRREEVGGLEVAAIDRDRFTRLVVECVEARRRLTVGYLNAHASNLAALDADFAAALRGFDLLLCDSRGLQLGCRILGRPPPPQVTSIPNLYGFPPAFAQRGLSPFLLGSRPGVAAKAARRLERDWPGFRVAGTHHGYFGSGETADEQLVAQINASQAPVLLVGLGMPRQELWIARNRARLEASVVIVTGAAFDWIAGEARPAPRWVSRIYLEWGWRLAQDPGRLWRRYLLGNPLFVARMTGARLRGRLERGLR